MNEKNIQNLSIIEYMKSAIDLCINSKLIELDEDYNKNGGTIIYAIDENIFNLFTNPKKISSSERGKRKHGVGEVFPADDEVTRTLLTRNLGGYLFTKKSDSNSIPFLMFSNTVNGLHNYVTRLIGNIIDEKDSVETLIEEILIEISAESLDYQKDKLLPGFDKLVSLINSLSSILLEHKKLSSLIKERVFYGGHKFLELKRFNKLDKKSKNLLKEQFSILESIELADSKNQWIKIIEKVSKSEISDIGEKHATILSRIQLINKHLNKLNYKLIFITTTNNIISASQNKIPDGNFPYLSFADNYIRTPKQFISKMFKNTDIDKHNNSISLDTWLDAYLTKVDIYYKEATLEELKELPANISDLENSQKFKSLQKNDFVEDVQKDWKKFNVKFSVSKLSTKKDIHREFSVLKYYPELNNRAKLIENINNLSGEIQQNTNEAWKDFKNIAIETGYWTMAGGRIVRLPPPVFFKQFPKTTEKLMRLILGQDTFNSNTTSVLLDDMGDECGNSYGLESYLYNVIFSVLFTVANRPRMAIYLAKEAITEVDNNESEEIDKREAYFLLAYNYRVSNPDNINHLDEAEEYLLKSKKTIIPNNKIEKPIHNEILEMRYLAEKLSLDISRKLRAIILGVSTTTNSDTFNIAKNISIVNDICAKASDILESNSLNRNQKIVLNILISSCCCDYYTLLFIRYVEKQHNLYYFTNEETHKINRKIFDYFDHSNQAIKDSYKGSSLFDSYVHTGIIYKFAKCLNEKGTNHNRIQCIKLIEIINETKHPSKYFKIRFDIWKEILKKMINE